MYVQFPASSFWKREWLLEGMEEEVEENKQQLGWTIGAGQNSLVVKTRSVLGPSD
jgi:hypothetical protein